LLEGIKQARQYLWVNPHARVGHRKRHLLVGSIGSRKRDGPAYRGELHGVLDKVPENLLQPGRIGGNVVMQGCGI
jgi:hypothetical protein